jgi:hypothetical protein
LPTRRPTVTLTCVSVMNSVEQQHVFESPQQASRIF